MFRPDPLSHGATEAEKKEKWVFIIFTSTTYYTSSVSGELPACNDLNDLEIIMTAKYSFSLFPPMTPVSTMSPASRRRELFQTEELHY